MYKIKLIFVVITSLFLFGCASDEYYKDVAADSAREFLFANLKHISQENRAYINYTYPEILQTPILINSEYSQFCFAWNLPSPEITLLVYGSSKNNFRSWFPVRVIFKKYSKEEAAMITKTVLEESKLSGETSDKINNRNN